MRELKIIKQLSIILNDSSFLQIHQKRNVTTKNYLEYEIWNLTYVLNVLNRI